MGRVFLILFTLFSAADLVNVWFDLPYRHFTKSMLIPCLACYLIFTVPRTKALYMFVVALVFAWLGDVFLLFSGDNFFLLGLVSFLVMQIIYSFIFYQERDFITKKALITAFFLIIFCVSFNSYLWPFVEEMRVPVIVYSIAIAIMTFTGIIRDKNLNGYQFIFLGVILFVVSDSILAINSFGPGFWNGGFLVMLTYILAQYFIVEGYARHLRSFI